MKTYSVRVPFSGYVFVDVKANNEKDVVDKALEAPLTMDLKQEDGDFADYEWELHRQIVKGNVFYGNLNEAVAELIDDEDE